jgi:hypothetical protein
MHLEVHAGSSWNAYRALDLYVSVFLAGMRFGSDEARYLLNADKPPEQRQLMLAQDWYRCAVWQSVGQGGSMSEWTLSRGIENALVLHRRVAEEARAVGGQYGERILRMLGPGDDSIREAQGKGRARARL